ncbi:hypothetical protein DCC79_06015 [bacterium]|nr:MAG: hypothetical protein DCC79_06015 [bacterium]
MNTQRTIARLLVSLSIGIGTVAAVGCSRPTPAAPGAGGGDSGSGAPVEPAATGDAVNPIYGDYTTPIPTVEGAYPPPPTEEAVPEGYPAPAEEAAPADDAAAATSEPTREG